MSSLLWLVAVTLNSPIVVGVIFSVLFQELFRFLIYLLLRKAEVGLKKLTESDTAIITNKNILAYGKNYTWSWPWNIDLTCWTVSGLGFGIISGTFSLVNVLADAAGPGTVGLRGDSNLFFLTSSVTTLCFILLHTAWGVLFFHGLDKKKYLALVWVITSHLLVSCLVSWYFKHVSQPEILEIRSTVLCVCWSSKIGTTILCNTVVAFCCM